MHDLILHHYTMSPFAEKVRLMLGYKGLAWRSVHIPSVMPKPDVVALTGGYRKTPVLQVGADVYCGNPRPRCFHPPRRWRCHWRNGPTARCFKWRWCGPCSRRVWAPSWATPAPRR